MGYGGRDRAEVYMYEIYMRYICMRSVYMGYGGRNRAEV
jgi:hypothetical protein